MTKEMVFEGYSLPNVHRIQLNFSDMSLNYHNWKSCFNRLCSLLEEGRISLVDFDKCNTLIRTYL